MHQIPKTIVVMLMAALCLSVVGLFAVLTYNQITWASIFDDVEQFGQSCESAITDQSPSLTSVESLAFQKTKIPYRGSPDAPRPKTGQYLIVQCTLDLQHIDVGNPVWVHLGPLSGQSQIFVSGEAVASTTKRTQIEFIMPPANVGKVIKLTIISKALSDLDAGPASLMPVFFTQDVKLWERVRRVSQVWNSEQPIFHLVSASLIGIFFGIMWLSGIRYADVLLLTAYASSLAMHALLGYDRFRSVAFFSFDRIDAVINTICAILPAAVLLETLRLERRLAARAGLIVVAVVTLTAIATVPDSVFAAFLFRAQLPAWVFAVLTTATLLCYVTMLATGDANETNRRTRITMFLPAVVASPVLATLQVILNIRYGVQLQETAHFLVLLCLSITFVTAFARRQHQYFEVKDESEKLRSTMEKHRAVATSARMVAHDVRRPFDLLRILTSRLLKAADNVETASILQESLPTLLSAQQSVDGILLDLTKLDEPVRIETSVVDLEKLTLKVESHLRPMLQEKSLRLRSTFASPRVILDEAKFYRVLLNLLTNAAHAADAGSDIIVAQELGETHCITVTNHGEPLAPELAEKVFELGATFGKADGSGVGLAVVKRFVNAHAGSVFARSDNASRTTTFVISLPRASLADETTQNLVRLRPVTNDQRPKAAIVDDDLLQWYDWEELLPEFDVTGYRSPEELRSEDPRIVASYEIILIDQHFHGSEERGEHLAATLVESLPKTLIYIVTSDASLVKLVDKRVRVIEKSNKAVVGQEWKAS